LKRIDYPEPLKHLIDQLKRMPAIGPRSAERIALWLVQSKNARSGEIADAVRRVGEEVRPCARCGFFATEELCEICSDDTRDHTTICVVEQPTDILPLERTGNYRGRYHSLGGRIAPLDHIGPEALRIDALIERVRFEQPVEVILALSADVEGEATASYIAGLLKESAVKVTRIAQGLPAGGGLDTADQLTLSRALTGRQHFAR
jgi:recombination protein RecR